MLKALELRIPPLVIVPLTALGMWLVSSLGPSFSWPASARMLWSGVLGIAGLGVAFAGVREFRVAKTTVNPMKPAEASRVVRSGIYRYTRNPMYLAVAMALLAWAAHLGHALAPCGVVLFVAWMNRFQIPPEERALAALFGDQFERYRGKVRRWI